MKLNRHNTISSGYLILLFGLIFFIGVRPGHAQTPEPTLVPTATPTAESSSAEPTVQAAPIRLNQNEPGVTEISFSSLNQDTFELRAPLDQQAFRFETPYRWVLTGEKTYLELIYDMQYDWNDGTGQAGLKIEDGLVNVYFNETLIDSFTPAEGVNQSRRIPVPSEAIEDSDQEEHRVRIVFFSGQCDEFQDRSLLVVHKSSIIHFAYDLLPIEANLADFPRPLIQQVFEPDSILLIIPDAYSDADLAAVASVAATMGQRSFGEVNLDLVVASEATPERLAGRSAIIIGQPGKNDFLLSLYQRSLLPTTLSADASFISAPPDQTIAADDGVIQEIISDVDDNYVYLVVTGATDAAVSRAAQALSILSPRYGFQGNLVVIEEFQETVLATPALTDTFTLADLGFEDTVFYGTEVQRSSARIFVPSTWRITDNPTLTLSYLHSAVVQNGSGLTVKLNNDPVGSGPIDDTIMGGRQVEIELSEDDFRTGAHNFLSFETVMNLDMPDCVLPDLDLAWMRIREDSQIHLPHTVEDVEIEPALEDALTFFASRQDLSDVWFSLPKNPTQAELLGLVRTAAWLGNFSLGPGFSPRVSREPITDTAQMEPYHLIAFGLPTENSVVSALNEALPQPFVLGTNTLRQEIGNVVYRLPENYSVGLLQAFSAPWNQDRRAVLAITGTTPEGVTEAIDALTSDDTYYTLEGDVAFIRGDLFDFFNSKQFVRSPLAAAAENMGNEEGTEVVLEEVGPAPTATPSLTSDPVAAISALQGGFQTGADGTPPPLVTRLTDFLIGAGLVIAVLGVIWNLRKTKS